MVWSKVQLDNSVNFSEGIDRRCFCFDCDTAFCDVMIVDYTEFCQYIVYGSQFWTLKDVPTWITTLDKAVDLNSYILSMLSLTEPIEQDLDLLTKGRVAKYILHTYALILLQVLSIDDIFAMSVHNVVAQFPSNILLTKSFKMAISQLNMEIGLNNLKTPWVQCHIKLGCIFTNSKKKPKMSSLASSSLSLCVPPPSNRSEIKTGFIQDLPQSSYSLFTSREERLYSALKAHVDGVPCGNPFNSLVRVLAFEGIIRSRYSILPIKIDNMSSILHNMYNKILAYNLLWPCFSIPVVSKFLLPESIPQPSNCIVVCRECGHCLNFGKGKFKKLTFRPNHKFYCRDQKEKHFSICASTGRIYCSFCGSADVKPFPLKFHKKGYQYIRVVMAGNCSIASECGDQVFDVIVPCMGEVQCSSVLLKTTSLISLLYLTSDTFKFVCDKCEHKIE
ncbi:ORF66 [Felid gammaherpesvirus 1]|uniref:ORF66 n=1 Tax=Felid gammaherpesvirus 1 TaxID=2560468 RepID=A0A0M5KXQ1_9GAMA|nr:ORF66 [Felis catus gammaherpesvirus 1]ALE14781.1 ORF66 [Felis catus gammaherpesvirus 1]